jgi:hypothetical protein
MKFAFSIWVVLASLTLANGQAPPLLKFDQQSIRVTGLKLEDQAVTTISDSEWTKILVVFTHEAWSKKINQPIAGTWLLGGDDIIFKPHFPFSPGETYHAIFDGRAFSKLVADHVFTGEDVELTFTLPQPEVTRTFIEAVYPTSKSVPENLLRMYICFSSPMMPGEAYTHIRLLRDDGSVVEKAFLIVDQELWDAERKRFTLLFDPGRIKRTLKSNLELGAPLKEGEKYLLVIDAAWRDVNGNPLQRSIKKEFTVTEATRAKLSKERMKAVLPKTNSREEVIMSFDRPMDHVLLSKHVTVFHSSTGEVHGTARMIDDFTWAFTPDQAWVSGQYELRISPWVEDVCGNNFNNAFDVDLEKEKRVSDMTLIRFPFTTKSGLGF